MSFLGQSINHDSYHPVSLTSGEDSEGDGSDSRESTTHDEHHSHSLDEIQIRAYRVHYEHGGIYGGYTLDEWLEAEHKLDQETDSGSQPDDGDSGNL
ncbi:MAG TPA: hypothetical protein VMH00_07355 [Candidatus Limnocylindrales bacterium]|nr:hypothetical protein [Candidatus Limnocylindrales bacterium]